MVQNDAKCTREPILSEAPSTGPTWIKTLFLTLTASDITICWITFTNIDDNNHIKQLRSCIKVSLHTEVLGQTGALGWGERQVHIHDCTASSAGSTVMAPINIHIF